MRSRTAVKDVELLVRHTVWILWYRMHTQLKSSVIHVGSGVVIADTPFWVNAPAARFGSYSG